MKFLSVILLSLILLTFSCKKDTCSNGVQDGKESGIDCGGDCVDCSEPECGVNTAMLGTWFYGGSSWRTYTDTMNGGIRSHGNVFLQPGCKIELTDVPYGGSNTGWYNAYGNFDACDYPFIGSYKYNCETKQINDKMTFDFINSDTMIFNNSYTNVGWSWEYLLYTKSLQPYVNDTTEIEWEIELHSTYPDPNEITFHITSNISGGDIFINIIPGQNLYTGTVKMYIPYFTGAYSGMSVNSSVPTGSKPNPTILSFTAKYKRGRFSVAEAASQKLCVGGNNSTCGSINPINGNPWLCSVYFSNYY